MPSGSRDSGACAKVCVTDWNGDGKLDILLGDICGGHVGKAPQTDDEKREETRARTELPRLRESGRRPTRTIATCGGTSPLGKAQAPRMSGKPPICTRR